MPNQARLAALNIVDGGSVCAVDHSPMMALSFFALLGVGLFTGLSHCLGMCGPLVGAFTLHRRAACKEVSTPLVLFQTGRLTTYVLLGAVAGGVGSGLAIFIRNWQGFFSVGLGLLVVLLGLGLLGFLPVQHWLVSVMPLRVISGWLKRLMTADHPAAPFGLGLTNGLLPCGPVYAMALLAAISGDALKGATVMLIFGLGTLPAMLGLGFTSSLISLRLRSHLFRAAAVLMVVVGVQLALRGLALGGQISHAAIGSVMLW
jgi:sulfite exporter TauE/SafE